jgi:hypothetical protein
MAATKLPFHGDDRNRHTTNELCAWLSAPSHSHAIIAAIHDGDNAAGLQILAPGVVFQPSVAQNWATGSQGRVEDQASSWSVISGTNICDISTDKQSDGSIAPDSTAAETISKCFGCDIYLRVETRTRRRMYSLAGTKNADLRLFINVRLQDCLCFTKCVRQSIEVRQ